MAESNQQLIVRGRTIREDKDGLICLDDLWELSGERPTREPKHWRNRPSTKRLELELLKKVRNNDLKGNAPFKPVAYAKRGRGQTGTYAHPVLAAAYAGYLHPKLKIEMLEVWLRYRSGDATLADDILERASPEANKWAAMRAQGRAKRLDYTETLRNHGVAGRGYGQCTDAIYAQLLGGGASRLRTQLGLSKKASLRDNLGTADLAYIMAAESLASDRIEEEGRYGNDDCAYASSRSASFIREAIERDKRDRQPKLPSMDHAPQAQTTP